ncbi:ABC transporter permease [Cellulosilyticum sp. ST5]|uniref:ABC transporter permease n=1 Tax=unclassified Cellulosilyticum TaxID=2643091 RepID=UPI000F8F81A3|nr:ABC transporter permease [Cellulosilyticum sp. WCF-2]QEH67196.1 ABC transporter permease [Cellulosilyticum sp. WCF-2]
MKRFLTLLKVEGRVALRGIDGIFFGVLMPVGIALLIGMICGDKPAFEGAEYTFVQGSFAALITVGICATAFMGIPLTVADYRDKKILKHYCVTPISPAVILLIQVVINMITALVSSVAVYLMMKFGFGYQLQGSILGFMGSYLLVMVAMYGLGMLMASLCTTIKTANLVCTLVYFPMLFLSGATIPYEVLPNPLQATANVLPLTQGIKLLKGYSLGTPVSDLAFPILLMLGIALISSVIAVKKFRWE